MSETEQTLYERIGGEAGIKKHNIDQQDVLDIMARVNFYADEITNDLPEYG